MEMGVRGDLPPSFPPSFPPALLPSLPPLPGEDSTGAHAQHSGSPSGLSLARLPGSQQVSAISIPISQM